MAQSTTSSKATFGAGCFWCVEAVFENFKGVQAVESGYTGGTVPNPTYEQVSSGRTGHAEVAQITFDPAIITYSELVEIFFHAHDPTTLNAQGADHGTQYRSAIFFHDDEQRRIAQEVKTRVAASGLWNSPIVTEISQLKEYYPAENYHQDYYRLNPNQPYCQIVIAPKLQKIYKQYGEKLR